MAARRRGEDIIDFGMGNPDGPRRRTSSTSWSRRRSGRHARILGVEGHSAPAPGDLPLVQAPLGRRVRPETEAIVTIGSKEGIAHLALATLGARRHVLVPNPSYPIHIYGPVIAGADIRHVPITPDGDFFGELEQRSVSAAEAEDADPQLPGESDGAMRRARTSSRRSSRLRGSTASTSCTTSAYADICFDGWKCPSIMEVPARRTSPSSSSR
jgi:alanine-synthesizing transaminase